MGDFAFLLARVAVATVPDGSLIWLCLMCHALVVLFSSGLPLICIGESDGDFIHCLNQ